MCRVGGEGAGVTEAEAVQLAQSLTESGRQEDAKALLLSVHADAADWPADGNGFNALVLLARCYRAEHDFDQARSVIGRAIGWAQQAGSLQATAVAFEGAALIEMEDDRIAAAGEFFTASAAAEGRAGNLRGRAAALSNYANMLTNRDIEGGEQLLREALRCVDPGDRGYPAFQDNLAGELRRQGRYDEAAEHAEIAVNGFLDAGLRYDAFIALQNLSAVLAGAGRKEESASAFTRAHDLIRDLRREEVNDEHYARYPERVREIEARSREVAKSSEMLHNEAFTEILRQIPEPVDPVDVLIGLLAAGAREAQEKGFALLESGQYFAAIESMLEARRGWEALQATHMLVTIDYHIGLALAETGDTDRSRPLLFRSFTTARELGDAFREAMGLSQLAKIGNGVGGRSRLDYQLSALALEPCTRRQLGWPPELNVPTDGGALRLQIANTCHEAGAYDLAADYYEQALRVARETPGHLGYRYAYRLASYLAMLRRADRQDQAAAILEELRAAAAELPADPRIDQALTAATTRAAYGSGERTQEVLDGLIAECRAYERVRRQARGLDLAGFAEANDPPYEEAAQVALALGQDALALGLLERGTAQTVFEALETDAAGALDEQTDFAALPPVGPAIAITLFPAGQTITLLALDGADGSVTRTVIEDSDASLRRRLRAFTDSADGERLSDAAVDTLGPVLGDATFRRLGEAVTELVPPGRKAWLVPHGSLHNAPLQLLPFGARRYPVMPSLAIAASLPPSRLPAAGGPSATGRGAVVACGDSLGDLPFARAETRLIAGEAGVLALGGECTADWLQAHLSASTSILHMACHGRFDRARPSRSGLALAAPPEEQLAGTSTARLLTLPEVTRLPLGGVTVVLSACSSGMETVRASEPTGLVSALLSAGAATVIAAQWPIFDLSAMLLMIRFYQRLGGQAASADLLDALTAAAADIRALTVPDLIEQGFTAADQLVTLGGTPGEADQVAGQCLRYALTAIGDGATADVVTAVLANGEGGGRLAALRELRPSPASGKATHPFADAAHWGAFKVVGRAA